MAKISYIIKSDGTPEGTKLTVNGEDITESKNVTNMWFTAHGGIFWGPGDELTPRVVLEYNTMTDNGQGIKTGENVTIDLNKADEPLRKAIGEPKAEVSDALLGRESAIVSKILGLKGKVKSFIPEKEVLKQRSMDSLKDTLSDLENEATAGN